VDEMGLAHDVHGRHENCIKNLFRKSEDRRSLGRFIYREKDNIELDLGELGKVVTDYFRLAQGRVQWRSLLHTVEGGKFLY
jgi:hypothetical protein